MATKLWQLKLKGERSATEIESTIGQSGGTVLRIHWNKGETDVYFSLDPSSLSAVAKAMKATGTPKEVNLSQVTKIS